MGPPSKRLKVEQQTQTQQPLQPEQALSNTASSSSSLLPSILSSTLPSTSPSTQIAPPVQNGKEAEMHDQEGTKDIESEQSDSARDQLKEQAVGIKCTVNSANEGFQGTNKQRYVCVVCFFPSTSVVGIAVLGELSWGLRCVGGKMNSCSWILGSYAQTDTSSIWIGNTTACAIDWMLRAFTDILYRYTDFQVHEMTPNGEVVHLTDDQAPKRAPVKVSLSPVHSFLPGFS